MAEPLLKIELESKYNNDSKDVRLTLSRYSGSAITYNVKITAVLEDGTSEEIGPEEYDLSSSGTPVGKTFTFSQPVARIGGLDFDVP